MDINAHVKSIWKVFHVRGRKKPHKAHSLKLVRLCFTLSARRRGSFSLIPGSYRLGKVLPGQIPLEMMLQSQASQSGTASISSLFPGQLLGSDTSSLFSQWLRCVCFFAAGGINGRPQNVANIASEDKPQRRGIL